MGDVVYGPLIKELNTKQDVPSSALHPINLPSINALETKVSVKPNGLEIDIAAIRKLLTRLVDDEKQDVVVVGHSYGGTPSLYACEGFWKKQRQEDGKSGGVLRVVLLSSSLVLPGGSVATDRAEWIQQNGGMDDSAFVMKQEGDVSTAGSCLILVIPFHRRPASNFANETDIIAGDVRDARWN